MKYSLTTETGDSLIVEAEGIGSPFDILTNQIVTLLDNQNYSVSKTQKTLVFSPDSNDSNDQQLYSQQITKPQPRMSTKHSDIPIKISQNIGTEGVEEKNSFQAKIQRTPISDFSDQLIEDRNTQDGEVSDLVPMFSVEAEAPVTTNSSSSLDSDIVDFKEEDSEEIDHSEDEDSNDDAESDIFHPIPPQKSY
ncbi:MAG: hypothetical protein ACW991_06950, partial [Candidatus Hodarchaeales archaeon]